jgi:RNA polymerase-binding transcription factor DksA
MRETLSAYACDVSDSQPINLDQIEQDLADVETALARLEAGTYWTDEVTGQPLPDELLAQRPTARRAENAQNQFSN